MKESSPTPKQTQTHKEKSEDSRSVSLQDAERALKQLRQRERKGADPAERSEYIRELLTSGLFAAWKEDETIDAKLTIDSIGLSIHAVTEGSRGFHTHLPIEECSTALVDVVAQQELFDAPEVGHFNAVTLEEDKAVSPSQHELALRVAEREGDEETVARMETELLRDCREAVTLSPRYDDAYSAGASSPRGPRPDAEFVLEALRWDPEVVARHIAFREHIPQTVIERELRTRKEEDPAKQRTWVNGLVRAAEHLNRSWDEHDHLDSTYGKWAWKDVKDSYEGAAVAKNVFAARNEEDQYSHRNYEAAKIMDTLLSVYSVEELAVLGYDVERSQHGKGASFVTFRRQGTHAHSATERVPFLSYNRVLLKPDKQLRSQEARDNFEEVPAVSRKDFEDYEALLLPYLIFRSLAVTIKYAAEQPDTTDSMHDLQEQVQGVLAIAVTEFPEHVYADIAQKARTMHDNPPHSLQELAATLRGLVEEYDATYAGSMQDVVREKLPDVQRTPIDFGPEYVKDLEQVFANSPERFDEDCARLPTSINVIETGGKLLPYAAEGRAVRALKLKPRPGIVVTGGAAHLSVDSPEHLAQAERMADAVLQAAITMKANVLIPGTQSGIGVLLAEKYQTYMQGLPEVEHEDAPYFFAIEPGKSLYYPGNDDVDWDAGHVYPVTAVDTIATPFHAGWSKVEEAETEQRRHNHYRQAIMNRASTKHGMVSVIANGGRWTILENTESAKEHHPLISLGDSGRVSTLLDHLARDDTLYNLRDDKDALIVHVLEYASALPDRGEFAQTLELLENNQAFRDDFFTLIQHVEPGQLQPASVDSLQESIETLLTAQNK